MSMWSALGAFFGDLKKKRIIEILAAFIGGGWLIIEFVDRILVAHYHFPDRTIDITFITLLCALICTLLWRWFSGREKPRKFKPEFVLIPLVLLVAILLDINLLRHLKATGSETFPPPKWKNSVAVLPFKDMSPQKDQDWFCEGITVEIINRLTNISELKVPARTSAFFFKGKDQDIRGIGRTLGVATVLEGTIQKAASELRVQVNLVNVADGTNIWSQPFNRDLKDVFAIQDEIALAVVDKLKVTLLGDEKASLLRRPIDNVAAYEYYLRAAREIDRFREDSLDRIVQYLESGLSLIGDNALLYAALAYAYWQYVNTGIGQEDYLAKSEDYARKALALDQASPKALVVLGLIAGLRGELRKSVVYLKKALALGPNDAAALWWLANAYVQYVGKIPAAAPLIERFAQLDPLNPTAYSIKGGMFLYDGRYDLAIDPFSRSYQMDPGNLGTSLLYALTLAYSRKVDGARSVIDKMAEESPAGDFTKLALAVKYALLNDRAKLDQLLTPDFEKWCKRDASNSQILASIMAFAGAKDEALAWLETAVNRGAINYPLLAERDPWLAGIRGEPRFKKLMERVKYEWEHFEE